MKGFISILELILVVIVLIVAFSILFPSFYYKTAWGKALLLLRGRDAVLTADRVGRLYDFSFNRAMLDDFLNKTFPDSSLIIWSETEGAIKSQALIACNCTDEQRSALDLWADGLRLNGRDIDVITCYTNLEAINPCIEGSDALLIWGYKDLSDVNVFNTLKDYLRAGNGIVEMMDLSQLQVDSTQQQIFGVRWFDPGGGWGPEDVDEFFKPDNASSISYQPYKFFYHIPTSMKAYEQVGSVPVEGDIPSCESTSIPKGNFTFREESYDFWICGDSVYFDTDQNGKADMLVSQRESFTISGYDFFLSYVDAKSIKVSFKQVFSFIDFLKAGGSKLYPADDDAHKILLHRGNWSNAPSKPIPVVILNDAYGKTAWIADFTRPDIANPTIKIGDDHKGLLTTLLLWATNKEKKETILGNLRVGYITSYINVNATDMFEVYKFNLGIGYPF